MPNHNTRRRTRSLNRGNTRKKLNRRAKSAEPYKNINAEKIGEGGFGVVSRPPARCAKFFSENSKNINQRNINSTVFQETYYKNPNYISKLSEWDMAEKELQIGNTIKDNIKYWRDYYCFIEFVCEAPADKHIRTGINDYQDTYGIAPYCGVTLKQLLSDKYHISAIECCCLMEALKRLAIGLSQLHRIQIYHQDIHDENVLFNPEDGKLRWIDFGLAEDHYDIKKNAINSGNNWQNNPVIVTARVEDTDGLIFSIIKPTLEFIRYKLRNSKKTKETEECLDDATYYLHKLPKSMDLSYMPNRAKSFDKYMEKLIEIEDTYIDFMEDFIGDIDEDKKCKWMFKNKNNK